VVLEGAGHFVQEDAAPEIIEAVNIWVTHDARRAEERTRPRHL
jgi:hypothetical protein